MFVFSTIGFFSVVQDLVNDSKLWIRSKNQTHLINLLDRFQFMELAWAIDQPNILHSPEAEYTYYISIDKSVWAAMVRILAEDINYSQFKMEISEMQSKTQSETQLQLQTMMKNDDIRIVNFLDNLKGSYAVKYVLEELLRKGNEHTLYSLLYLIKSNQNNNSNE